MTSKADLENALKDAMRSGDDLRKSTLRMVLSNIRMVEVEARQKGVGASLDDNGVIAVLQKEVKSRREAIAEAQRASRPDLVAGAEAEIAILENYLPKSLSADELEALARQAVAETGATSLREMGAVMKVLMPRLQGRVAGDQASAAVRKLLN